MQLSAPDAAPMRVLATVDNINRSGRSMDARTLVIDGPAGEAFAELDAAIEATSAATKGAKVGAAAILQRPDGTFQARPILDLADGSPFATERSRAKRPLVTGQMDVHALDVAAIVDGTRIERMPDYSQANPASWQDRQLFELVAADGTTSWGFSTHRSRYARTDASHFTKVGADFDATVERAQRSAKRDGLPLMIMQDDAGDYYMTGFTGSGYVKREGAAVRPTDDAVKAIVGASGQIDLLERA